MLYFSSVGRRLRFGYEVAVLHHLRHVLLDWRVRLLAKLARKESRRLLRLRNTFDSWVAFIPLQRRERFQVDTVEAMHRAATESSQTKLLRRWSLRTKKRLRLERSRDAVKRTRSLSVMCSAFRDWRGVWLHHLYWRGQEQALESLRLAKMHELKVEQVGYLEEERETLLDAGKELIALLSEQQAACIENEKTLNTHRELLRASWKSKEDLDVSVTELKSELCRVRAERERLRVIESIVDSDKMHQEEEVRRRRLNAECIVNRLQREKEDLKMEVAQAREQAAAIERSASFEVMSSLDLLSKSQWTSTQMKSLIGEKKAYVEELEKSLHSFHSEMQSMQLKIRETSRDGSQLLEDGEKDLRRRSLAVKALRARRGQLQARVCALRDIVDERRRAVDATRWEGLMVAEAR
jgi:hypothetical protein